jgi:predicted ATP-dependent endonuclease of OLD family
MKLAYCKIKGYKRFEDTTVNLDRNLIAFVGPNEAGKSSFFEALASTENEEEFTLKELSRDKEYEDDHDVIELAYSIEQNDLSKLKELNGVGEPKFYKRFKSVDGNITYSFSSEIKRNKILRNDVISKLEKFNSSAYFKSKLEKHIIEEADYETNIPEYTMHDLCKELIQTLNESSDNLSSDELENLIEFNNHLEPFKRLLPENKTKKVEELINMIPQLANLEAKEHPETTFQNYLSSKRQKIIFFDKENRELKETYTYGEIGSPPPALNNILSVAEIDNESLIEALDNNNSGLQESILENGNENLKKKYNKYWNQADVFPRLKLENNEIRILLRFVNSYNNLSDRSDGLKQFIALLAFALNNDEHNDLILLIDEAEIHLHYAAQADIVQLFERQKIVNSIFYSTHSAGCLPSDLGTGIRAVQPIKDESNKETTTSEIRNSIWSNTAGFSPILLAMGANIIAFSMARKALIAEGPSETILLPRLLRETSDNSELDFQVAPGLASISVDKCKELDLEASRVAFIVDGDEGGIKIKKKLTDAKFKPSKIISLPKDYVLEDFIDKEILLNAINSIIKKFQTKTLALNSKSIPSTNSIKYLENECKKQGIKFPSKVLIAEEVVSNDSSLMILRNNNKSKLLTVLNKIKKSLE